LDKILIEKIWVERA